ncbi:Spherical Body Protein 2 truncated copy 10 (SBP2) [Babesia bovis T2Bo]|uniref:Spherical Body Protein 2 truncated copy 10 (SBP2) n=1 Tax=Babesia bovis TaxID=5865 RepID=A7ANS9_BABBO|nr:Spherical Body Protein 2 truncated copy 10 (SBP2) [Babesia bovis T2Bo]EDO08213.1 Spherical Body Protein 2 truncated copy 10 (SBP2) [Babesia bovis T2Bo]|eukprot:XP_001611781.1 Spherical Body Protein 2 truncated copy 10 (SBP2) [Babesia bovis T2Bo]
MELARRNNGFRKVAKWIAGALVVAGAASGNVDAESHLHGGKSIPSNAPEAVVFVSSLGKEYTNKEIDNLVDRSGLKGSKGVIRHMLGVRRAELLREMRKFNRILESLPEDIAVKAGAYATYDKLPADLAEKVKWSHLNTTTFGLLEKVPQNLANEMLACDIYEGFPADLIDKINEFLHPFDPSTVINDKEEDGKSVDGTPATPGSTEVTEEAEEREDAIKESDDSVNEGKESKEEE